MNTHNCSAIIALVDSPMPHPVPRKRERGIALVIALVFLVMLTILGVSLMNTTSLEGRMAGNAQETNRAFHTAESAIDNALADKTFATLIHIGDTNSTNVNYGGTKVVVTTTYMAQPPPGRTSNRTSANSVLHYGKSVFDLKSSSTTETGARTTVFKGIGFTTPSQDQ